MKKLLLLTAIFALTTSCARKDGVTLGLLVDASKEGTVITSCEIDVQYGNESSRIENFSNKNPALCDELVELTGKKVKVHYHYENFNLATNDGHIFDSVTEVE